MKRKPISMSLGLIVGVLMSVAGCGIWPVMTEDNGRRPVAMGKSDQVFWPWATQPVHLSEDYGVPYRYALENQILNPQAGNSLEVVEGIGGTPGQLNMERYQALFKTPPFTVGGSSSSKQGGTK